MVRFIIFFVSFFSSLNELIYIPIWLDLLFQYSRTIVQLRIYLHSNMVRFIICIFSLASISTKDIYIPIWLDLLCKYLQVVKRRTAQFTFQYGQIYYLLTVKNMVLLQMIYIPIWLDLLFLLLVHVRPFVRDLHSNMVRFIIYFACNSSDCVQRFTFQYGQIYY